LLAEHPQGGALVFDLRHNPEEFVGLDAGELAEAMRWKKPDDTSLRLPVKTLKYNRCPMVAPLGVLDESSQKRLQLDPAVYAKNFTALQKVGSTLAPKILEALKIMDQKQQARLLEDEIDVDARLYDKFFDTQDKTSMRLVRAASADELSSLHVNFRDDRLEALLPLYKARNYPKSLSDEERATWETFRERKLLSGGNESRAARYFKRLAELAEQTDLSGEKQYILEELQLYGQSILPEQN
jgi:exodeoxyribonuclease I